MPTNEEINEATRRLHVAGAELMAAWAERGAAIAKKYGYGELTGLDAIHRFLMDKYHWLPCQVRALNIDEIELLLAGVALPSGARGVSRSKSKPDATLTSGPRQDRLTLR
jgi:hypothetical protein